MMTLVGFYPGGQRAHVIPHIALPLPGFLLSWAYSRQEGDSMSYWGCTLKPL
jgi:hypothetical protein